jgi:hypothetical protein
MAQGVRGSGKSSLLEALGEHYLTHRCKILDLFGSRSGEGLAWLRSPWVRHEGYRPLLLRGVDTEVRSRYDVLSWRDFEVSIFNEYDVVISSSPLYPSINEEFRAVNHILDRLFQRFGWRRFIYIICREAANLFYSRMKLRENQLAAKTEAIYLLRESRHHGLILGLDTQKFTAIDSDIRNLLDYLVIKAHGYLSLPRDLWFIYRYIKPEWIQLMKPQHFIILSRRGSIGVGEFSMPYWHKRPKENLLRLLDIEVVHKDRDEL